MRLIKFEASWCEPCKQLTRWIETQELPYELKVVDIDEQMDIAKQYNVRGIPTVVLVNDEGQVQNSVVGFPDIKAFLQDLQN